MGGSCISALGLLLLQVVLLTISETGLFTMLACGGSTRPPRTSGPVMKEALESSPRQLPRMPGGGICSANSVFLRSKFSIEMMGVATIDDSIEFTAGIFETARFRSWPPGTLCSGDWNFAGTEGGGGGDCLSLLSFLGFGLGLGGVASFLATFFFSGASVCVAGAALSAGSALRDQLF